MSNSLRSQFQQINQMLRGARKVFIASHQTPDSDAVGSVLGLRSVFKTQGLQIWPYLPDPPSKKFSFLPGFFEIRTALDPLFQPDLLFCLDYGDFGRLQLPENLFPEERIITIDHHLESDHRGKVKIIEEDFSSTAEIIYYWLKFSDLEINQEIAICLLSGILSDSGGFSHLTTTSNTLRAVSELLSTGVPINKITRKVLTKNFSLSISRAWGKILSRIRLDEPSGLAYSWLDLEDFKRNNLELLDLEGITNLLSFSSPGNLGLLLVEYKKGKIKGSLRSEPYQDALNKSSMRFESVVRVAKTLGGGGHPYAAGFEQEGTIEEVLKKVLNLLR